MIKQSQVSLILMPPCTFVCTVSCDIISEMAPTQGRCCRNLSRLLGTLADIHRTGACLVPQRLSRKPLILFDKVVGQISQLVI